MSWGTLFIIINIAGLFKKTSCNLCDSKILYHEFLRLTYFFFFFNHFLSIAEHTFSSFLCILICFSLAPATVFCSFFDIVHRSGDLPTLPSCLVGHPKNLLVYLSSIFLSICPAQSHLCFDVFHHVSQTTSCMFQ